MKRTNTLDMEERRVRALVDDRHEELAQLHRHSAIHAQEHTAEDDSESPNRTKWLRGFSHFDESPEVRRGTER